MRAIRHRRRSIPALAALAAAAVAAPVLLTATPAAAHPREGRLAKELVEEVGARGAYRHLEKFQQIADTTGGHRAAGTLGHDASAAYVYQQLKKDGYDVSYQQFDFIYTETQAEKLSVVSPAPRELAIDAMTYTKSTPVGGVKADARRRARSTRPPAARPATTPPAPSPARSRWSSAAAAPSP